MIRIHDRVRLRPGLERRRREAAGKFIDGHAVAVRPSWRVCVMFDGEQVAGPNRTSLSHWYSEGDLDLVRAYDPRVGSPLFIEDLVFTLAPGEDKP